MKTLDLQTKEIIDALVSAGKHDLISAVLEKAKPIGVDNDGQDFSFLEGKYVIIRATEAGVHCGYYVSHKGREVILKSARRLWYWKCQSGHSLSGLADGGLHGDSKVSAPVEDLVIMDGCEIIVVPDNGSFVQQPIHNK